MFCQSVCPTGSHVTVSRNALDLTIQGLPCTWPLSEHWTSCSAPSPGHEHPHRSGHGTSTVQEQSGPNPPVPKACLNVFNLDLTVQGPLPVTSGGNNWRPVQTCSLEDPLVLTSGGYWSLYGRQVASTYPTCCKWISNTRKWFHTQLWTNLYTIAFDIRFLHWPQFTGW